MQPDIRRTEWLWICFYHLSQAIPSSLVELLVSDALHLSVHLWKVHAEHGEQKAAPLTRSSLGMLSKAWAPASRGMEGTPAPLLCGRSYL